MIGETISHYRILERIGAGGMGVVYRAEDTSLKRHVALKFLPPRLTADHDAVARFEREAQTAAALNHPNIVTVYEIGRHEDQIFIAMELVEGRTLREMIDERPLPLDQALDIAVQTGEALAKAHEAGVVHRDVKPANVLVDTDGRVRVLDFGLAKLRGVVQLTQEMSTLGTVRYMSPEQAAGGEVDRRSDVWSLGVVLYEMVAGRRPFDGEFENAVIYAITNENPEPVTALRSGVPLDVERIIAKALAKKPAERYQRVDEMLVDLRAAGRALDSGVQAPPVTQRPRVRKRVVAGVGVLVILAAFLVVLQWLPRPIGVESSDRKSIAVLPFHNLSPDPENEYFTDGITEDITTQLSKIADLRVISRTSTLRYKDTHKPVREIGEELGVAVILEGSVRRVGDRVRIVGQLIDTRTDEHLWASTYDRTLDDIFQIQSDVAQQIARALEATLSPEEAARIEAAPTKNLEAYETYLRGREYYNRYVKEDNEVAVALFKKAVEEDPEFALAYAGLADAYGQRALRFDYSVDWIDSSLATARRAIAIRPDVAEGYKALGLGLFVSGRYREGLEASLRATELNPNLTTSIGNIGITYLMLGYYDETIYWLRKDIELSGKETRSGTQDVGLAGAYEALGMYDRAHECYEIAVANRPEDIWTRYWVGNLYLVEGRYDKVAEQIAEIERYGPGTHWGHWLKADLAMDKRDFAAAKRHVLAAIEATERGTVSFELFNAGNLVALGFLLHETGDPDSAATVLAEAERMLSPELAKGTEDYSAYSSMAMIHILRGEEEDAMEDLRRAFELGKRAPADYERDPAYDAIRDTPAFQEFFAEVKENAARMHKRVEDNDW